MSLSFRDVELAGWTAQALGYDRSFSAITGQVIQPILDNLGEVRSLEILDVCCGPGHLTAALGSIGARVEGIDFAATMVARARENHPAVNFSQADAEALPFRDESFDAVVCAYGVMHLANADQGIAEAFRVLRPTGRYVFTQWALDDEMFNIVSSAIQQHGEPVAGLPSSPPPLRFSDPQECRRVLEATGFRNVRIERVEVVWRAQEPKSVIDLIYDGAVRVAMLLHGQSDERRTKIHEALHEAARARRVGDEVHIKRPTIVVMAEKP